VKNTKILLSLSQDFTTYHTNDFIIILFLSKGRAVTVWGPYKKIFLHPPRNEASVTSPQSLIISYSLLSFEAEARLKNIYEFRPYRE
jgi:hypothetical protein